MQELPERQVGSDTIHALLKGAAALVPGVGGPLTVLMETLFAPPIERRRDNWLRMLASAVEELQRSVAGLTPQTLSTSESFITVALQATQIAVRTHREEKLSALKNAVLSAGLPGAPSDERQAIYLRFVDELTPLHLRVLALYADPSSWLPPVPDHPDDGWGMSVPREAIGKLEPELADAPEFYEQVIRDLQVRSLVKQGLLTHFKIARPGVVEAQTTAFGRDFLAYIFRGAS